MMFWFGHGFGYGNPWLMALGLGSGFVFWAGVALLIIWGIRALITSSAMNRAPAAPASRAPREILDERLAKGEITTDDYETAKTALGGW